MRVHCAGRERDLLWSSAIDESIALIAGPVRQRAHRT